MSTTWSPLSNNKFYELVKCLFQFQKLIIESAFQQKVKIPPFSFFNTYELSPLPISWAIMEKKSEIRNPNILIFKEKISHKLFGHQMRPIVNVKLRLIINKPNDNSKQNRL
jgi:hypothetical protein